MRWQGVGALFIAFNINAATARAVLERFGLRINELLRSSQPFEPALGHAADVSLR